MLIDTHAHLNLDPLYSDWHTYAETAFKAGVEKIIVPGANLSSSQRSIAIAAIYPDKIYAAIGIHPEEINDITAKENLVDQLRIIETLTNQPRVVAIGEIGLDYHYFDKNERIIELQRFLFREQLQLAKENNLSVLIHTRRSQAIHDACDDILRVYGKHKFRGVFHSFTGTKSHYERIKSLHAYIGVGGLITYPHNGTLRKLIQTIPLEQIVVETDSPWLTPHPKNDTVNQPQFVTITALKLAEILNLPFSHVMKITTNNALELLYV